MFEWESQNWPRRNEKHRDKKENKKEKKVSKSSVVNTYGTMTPFLPPQIDFTVEPTDLKIISRWRGVIPTCIHSFHHDESNSHVMWLFFWGRFDPSCTDSDLQATTHWPTVYSVRILVAKIAWNVE